DGSLPMGVSRLDVLYRKLLLTKLFMQGWGKPEDLKRHAVSAPTANTRPTIRAPIHCEDKYEETTLDWVAYFEICMGPGIMMRGRVKQLSVSGFSVMSCMTVFFFYTMGHSLCFSFLFFFLTHRIFEFRKLIGDREKCKHLVPRDYPVVIDKVEEQSDCRIHNGHFISPLAQLVPGILPTESVKASFQFIVPKRWRKHRPVCIHLAGTGDHVSALGRPALLQPSAPSPGSWLKRFWPLVFAVFLEEANPHGQAHDQRDGNGLAAAGEPLLYPLNAILCARARARAVCALGTGVVFLMCGVAPRVLKAFQSEKRVGPLRDGWCARPGVRSSTSLAGEGGLLATGHDWHLYGRPYGVFSCDKLAQANSSDSLSLLEYCFQCFYHSKISRLSAIGVLSKAVNWRELQKQYAAQTVYEEEIVHMLEYCGTDSFRMGQDLVRDAPGSLDRLSDLTLTLGLSGPARVRLGLRSRVSGGQSSHGDVEHVLSAAGTASAKGARSLQRESLSFMKGVMDECTHIANFSVPVDPSLIIIVQAKEDAYVPRAGVRSLQEIWPGCEVRYLDGGHISAYLFKQALFRKAIYDAFSRFLQKYPAL
ncbi:hypothetical protein P4O66_007327, partial [Electrophorus voltai]